MNSIKAVLFDLDNTLLDRQTAFLQVAQAFYNSYAAVRGKHTQEEVVSLLVSWDAFGTAPRHAFERALDAWPDIGISTCEMMGWYYDELCRAIKPDKRALALVADLNKEGLPWGVVTNGSAVQHVKVKVAGVGNMAPFVIVSSDFGHSKPEPPIFHEALRRLGGIPAENTLFVGDNPDTDIKGAETVGMQTAWVRLGRHFPEHLPPPDHEVDHVVDLRPIILGSGTL
jgi:putative hydrolase of the HAD superfamily